MSDPSTTPDKRSYKKTLNLPKTAFPMKANLVQNEPASIQRWDQLNLYRKLREQAPQDKPFVFHDGPPYANGDIHLGHLLNKCLKDFVVRSKTMLGYDCPYTPGWDCHGLPIEHKVMQERQKQGAEGPRSQGAEGVGNDLDPAQEALSIRKACAKYAGKHVKTQSQQMQRLLTLAGYDNPYLTMAPKYEAGVLEVFAAMIERGLVYRDLKPVHWSIDNQTALAEAELEYYDREDTSVYVRFAGAAGDESFMIWTTTPWTLPANLAVAVHPRMEYGLYTLHDQPVWIAVSLAKQVAARQHIDLPEPQQIVKGEALVGKTYNHPFIERQGRVVAAEYVTAEDGTGLVHTAPGHGTEDYQTGLREGLDVYCPVRPDGTYDDTVPDWLAGRSIWNANDLIVERLRETGHLFHDQKFNHSYPHDWRGKKPVIFRATEQWFIAVDQPFQAGAEQSEAPDSATPTLRGLALQQTADAVNFIPAWGRNRMRGMLESRPDWCVSRQRAWGLPIPAFFPPDGVEGPPLLTPASVTAVGRVFADRGSDSWFYLSPQDLLQYYDWQNDDQAPAWLRNVAKAEGWPSLGLGSHPQLFRGPGLPHRPLPRRQRPAPRLVPALAPARPRRHRQTAFPHRPDPRVHGRQGRQKNVQVRRQRPEDRRPLQRLRRRHLPLVGRHAEPRQRHQGRPELLQARRRGIPQGPQHPPLPAEQPRRLCS